MRRGQRAHDDVRWGQRHIPGGGVIDGKSGSNWRGGARDTEPERDVYRGGRGPSGVMNVGEGDSGARLTVAERVALRETCVGEATEGCRDSEGGEQELPVNTWED